MVDTWDVASYTTSALLHCSHQQVEVLFAEMEQNEGASVDGKDVVCVSLVG